MKKIIIIGVTGSGKSTLAIKLSEKLECPYIQLDNLYWNPNWKETPDDEFFKKITNAIDCESWVLDGNYGRTNHITWKESDTIVWLDFPLWLALYQNISRSILRAVSDQEIWEGSGNKETFSRMFSKKSIVGWLFKTYDQQKKRYEARLKLSEYSNIKFYRLRSRKEVRNFMKNINIL